jgi:NAD kinase
MTTAKLPRVVLVTRTTDYQNLLVHHGTREAARFFLETRGQRIEDAEGRHQRFEAALRTVLDAIPLRWRRSRIDRRDLAAFVFEPEDVVVALGQDGLVANVAKYLEGQLVLGINSDPGAFEGVLVPHAPEAAPDLLQDAVQGRSKVEPRALVEASLDDGQKLLALNEVFIGHHSHQSAKYRIRYGGKEERQSSSGLIVATGTGVSGWARSIARDRKTVPTLPKATDPQLAFFVREAWPSRATGAELTQGNVDSGHPLELISEMNDGGVLFGDGIEEDRLAFEWGMKATLTTAPQCLRLIR